MIALICELAARVNICLKLCKRVYKVKAMTYGIRKENCRICFFIEV